MNNPADLSVSPIKLRQNGRLMTTGYGNEIADKLNKSRGLPGTGQGSVNGTTPVSVIVKITGVLDDRNGWYSGKLFSAPPITTQEDIDNSESLVEGDVGETGDDDNATVWNIPEINGGSPLATGDVISGWIRNTDFDGKPIVIVEGASVGARTIVAEPRNGSNFDVWSVSYTFGSGTIRKWSGGSGAPTFDMTQLEDGGILDIKCLTTATTFDAALGLGPGAQYIQTTSILIGSTLIAATSPALLNSATIAAGTAVSNSIRQYHISARALVAKNATGTYLYSVSNDGQRSIDVFAPWVAITGGGATNTQMPFSATTITQTAITATFLTAAVLTNMPVDISFTATASGGVTPSVATTATTTIKGLSITYTPPGSFSRVP